MDQKKVIILVLQLLICILQVSSIVVMRRNRKRMENTRKELEKLSTFDSDS